jgi:protein-disulfide isomerase
MKNNLGIIFVVLAVLAIGAAVVYSNYAGNQANEGVEITANVKGSLDADVTLVKYSDFQCGACAQFAPYVDELVTDYGDQLRVEYRHFPLISIHPFAVPAARAAEAAGQQGKFWEMHDALFENQAQWSGGGSPTPFFYQYAEEIGLDMDLFRQHMRASLIEDHVNDQFREARELGFSGTPSFTLNGEQMQFQTFEEFRSQVEVAIGVIQPTAETGVTGDQPAADTGPDVQFGI